MRTGIIIATPKKDKGFNSIGQRNCTDKQVCPFSPNPGQYHKQKCYSSKKNQEFTGFSIMIIITIQAGEGLLKVGIITPGQKTGNDQCNAGGNANPMQVFYKHIFKK